VRNLLRHRRKIAVEVIEDEDEICAARSHVSQGIQRVSPLGRFAKLFERSETSFRFYRGHDASNGGNREGRDLDSTFLIKSRLLTAER
jgi:hypothetical protein